MRELNFTKMHGAGNDFIIIDNRNQSLTEPEIVALAPRLCHRHFGIGADGIIALQSAKETDLDYTMFYRNPDGSDAGMCGNGARCLAFFAARAGMGRRLAFKVHDTVYEAIVDPDQQYVTLSFPMRIDVKEIASKMYRVYAGTEHIVLPVSESDFEDDTRLREQGKRLRYDERFDPPGTNVNFITGVSSTEIQIKTYERGVEDLTLACGTGTIAAALAWHHIKKSGAASQKVGVNAAGGKMHVEFIYDNEENHYKHIRLSGNAEFVFKGTYAL